MRNAIKPIIENEKVGSLEKQTNGKWKKGYFVLKDGVMNEYQSFKGKLSDSVPLYDCTVGLLPETKKGFHISVNGQYLLILKAQTDQEVENWISSILLHKESIEKTILKIGVESQKEPQKV